MNPLIQTFWVLLVGTGLLGLLVTVYPHRKLDIWLVVMVVMLYALPRAGVAVPQVSLPLPYAHLIAAGAILFWFCYSLRRPQATDERRLNLLFLVYVMLGAMGWVLGMALGGSPLIAFLELCFYVLNMGLFFYARSTFSNPQSFRLFVWTGLLVSVAVSLYGVAQAFWGADLLVEGVTFNSAHQVARAYVAGDDAAIRRVLSSYGDPNVLASQLLVFAGMAFALMLSRSTPVRLRWAGALICLCNVWAIYQTGSRMGLVCLLVLALIVISWHRPRVWFLLFGVAMVGVVIGPELFAAALANRFQGVIQESDIRLQFPMMAWQLLRAAPFGCGFGNTVDLSLSGMNWSFAVKPAVVVWAGFNSFWLNLFSRMGLLGVLCFVGLLLTLFQRLWTQSRRMLDPVMQACIVGGLAGVAGQWLTWVTNNTYMLPGGGLNFWFFLGMLAAGCRAYSVPAPMVLPVAPAPQGYVTRAWPPGRPALGGA